MNKIQIVSRYTGALLFEHECDDNTIRKTIEAARASGANLREADLREADLRGANLRGADLCEADLRGADLRGANLRGANLCEADLREADLREANLRGADLCEADLREAKNADLFIAMTRILPEGDIIGYKKCRDDRIVKLLIPKESKRSNAFGRKCRAEYADVLDIRNAKNGKCKTAVSLHDSVFLYEVGQRVSVNNFDENWQNECSTGIHFYITREEAEAN